jgi:hypothetical protein
MSGHGEDETPPFLGTWKNVYIMVVVYLVGVIAVLYWLSRLWVV